MPFHEPTVRASILVALPSYLGARDVDIRSLLSEAGLSETAADNPDEPLPLNNVGMLFELTASRLADPGLGISYAKVFPPGATGLLGHLMITAPTVRDVFQVLTRYLQVHTTPMQSRFEIHDDGVGWFSFAWPSSFTAPQIQYTGFAMASLILRLRRATGPNWLPLAVHFHHRAPDDVEPYRHFFGSRLKFDQRDCSIAVDASTLAMPMPELLPKLHETVRAMGDRVLKEHVHLNDAASQLQHLLADRLPSGQPFDLDSVAKALGTQPRGLQWRLQQEATTYEQVLLLTRMLHAERHLRDSNHPMTEIANLLGFSELSAFTRWCQRHYKMTPSASRRHLRQGGGAAPPPSPRSPLEDPA